METKWLKIPELGERIKDIVIGPVREEEQKEDENSIIVPNVAFTRLCEIKKCDLRTVTTKYKGFCARLGPRGKGRTLQGLLESTKKNRGSPAFFRDN